MVPSSAFYRLLKRILEVQVCARCSRAGVARTSQHKGGRNALRDDCMLALTQQCWTIVLKVTFASGMNLG